MKKIIYINSQYKDSGSNEDFTINDNSFNSTIKKVRLLYAAIPYTWYNIDGSNNRVDLIISTVTFNISIPPGNYSANDLAETLQKIFNDIHKDFIITVNDLKFTISNTIDFSLDFKIDNSLADRLGFNKELTPLSKSHTSSKLAKIIDDYEIFICSNLISGIDNGNIWLHPKPPTDDQILAVVPITGCFGSVIQYQPIEDIMIPIQQNFFQNSDIRFFLRFPSGFPIKLNNQFWTARILFEF